MDDDDYHQRWMSEADFSQLKEDDGEPSRVAVDETAVTIETERHWLYATIDVETKLLLDVWISGRPVTSS